MSEIGNLYSDVFIGSKNAFFQSVDAKSKTLGLLKKAGTRVGAVVARKAGLSYFADEQPGITRHRKGSQFRYLDADGKTVKNLASLQRIQHLAIPPAWEEVWISASENGHLQAVGRDVKGRKQYRYHENWREVRDKAKYDRMVSFGRALPKLRRKVERDLTRKGLPREKVLATVVRLLETTLIRVGNDEYARENHSYGLTTMHDSHVNIRGERVTFSFRGKSGKTHVIDLSNRRLAKIIKNCRDLPGNELFQYQDEDGKQVDVTSTDVNSYLHEVIGGDFTAKDFRTWAGTVMAARALREFEKFTSKAEGKRNLLKAIAAVAKMLGNTPTICRSSYVHPLILNTYLDGSLFDQLQKEFDRKVARELKELRAEESAVLMLLQRTLKGHHDT